MNLKLSKHCISQSSTIKDALAQINSLRDASLVLFVITKSNIVVGSITDGDIRRSLLAGFVLSDNVCKIMQKNFKYVLDISDYKKISLLKKEDLKIVPHVTKKFALIDLIDLTKTRAVLPICAIIMAGGKGLRLKPFTNNYPKPMLPLGDKPIIAHNIDRLISYGIKKIYISVNHMKEQIIKYIEANYADYDISFIHEDVPLGTIGAIRQIKNLKHKDVLVMNADILTNIDYYDFFVDYKELNYDMAVSTFNVRINIPYAVLDTVGTKIKSFIEKPSYVYHSNAGIYLLKKEHIKYIPKNKKYDSTDLIEKLIRLNKSVGHFSIRGYWLDIGNAQNYAKAQDDVKHIKF